MIIYQDAKKLTYFNFINILLSITIFKFRLGLLLCLFLKIMKSALSISSDSLFNLNQFDIFFNSLVISFYSCLGSLSLEEKNICVVSKIYKMRIRRWEGKVINVK